MEITNINQLVKGENIIRKARNRENPYAQINKSIINDTDMSYKALGIATYILSKPNDWQVFVSDVVRRHSKTDKPIDAEKSVRVGLKELKERGYLQRYPVYVNGYVYCWKTLLNETPYTEDEIVKNIKYEVDELGNVISEEITYENGKNLLTQKGKVVENTILAEKVQVGLVQVGKEGLLINDLTNNDLTDKLKVVVEVAQQFEDNICKLKPITKDKLIKAIESHSKDFLLKVIEICAESNIKSYTGFKTVLKGYVDKGYTTADEIDKDLEEYRLKSKELRDKERDIRKNKGKGNTWAKESAWDFKSEWSDYNNINELENKLLGRK